MLIKLPCIQLKYCSLSEKPIKAVYGCDMAALEGEGRGDTSQARTPHRASDMKYQRCSLTHTRINQLFVVLEYTLM